MKMKVLLVGAVVLAAGYAAVKYLNAAPAPAPAPAPLAEVPVAEVPKPPTTKEEQAVGVVAEWLAGAAGDDVSKMLRVMDVPWVTAQ